ncbi:protein ULTRAPETALA 1-like [Capsicum annuum]|uniref:protein ULTRAPETALA 1-like n=1 Tax=Capsicum annuum TaxID=4072 RepID=UPI001FB11C19|nr:protein ULTRAPETALA 1-like [Capsicum annuum]
MFTEEEIRGINVLKRGDDYIEIFCCCTSPRHGDFAAKLRVLASGELEITCECQPGCLEGKLTPIEFEKHAGRETCRKWKNNIWIFIDGNKVPLVSTVLLKYHNQSSKHAYGTHRFCHRDEFIICTECKKERRFCRHSVEECKSYHDALLNTNWKCADISFGKFSCDDKEERKSRRVYRGCLRSSTCEGCSSCVCFGCQICCFSSCSCQTCIDFTKTTKA